MQLNSHKLFHPLLLLNNILFLSLYVILLYYNRYAADDYFFVYDAKIRGVIGAALFTAQTWTPRPTEMLLYNTLTKYLSEQTVLILYGLSVMMLLILAIYKFITLFSKKINIQLNGLAIQYSVLLSCSFFFASFSIGETWFWLCSSAGYLLSLIAFLFGLILIINKKNNLITYVLLTICFGYVMGAAETFAAFVLIICWTVLFVYVFKNRSHINTLFRIPAFKKLLFISCISLVALLIIYFSVGTQFRKSLLTQASLTGTLYHSGKTMAWLFIKRIPDLLPYLLLFSTPFLSLGNKLNGSPLAASIFTRKYCLLICLSFLVLTYVSLLPASYIMSDRGPDRSFTVISFLLTVLFAYLFAFIGFKTKDRIKDVMMVLMLGINICLLTFICLQQYGIAKHYSAMVDQRIELVIEENKKGRIELMKLQPLPPSGFYYSAELSNDTAYYTNAFFKQRFGLNFSCVVK